MEGISGLTAVLEGLKSFQAAAGATVTFAVLALYWRKNRFEEDKQLSTFHTTSVGQLQTDLATARAELRKAQTRINRLLEAARWWFGRTHGERLSRMEDRGLHRDYERENKIPPLTLPEIPELPELIEDNGE